MLDFRSQRSTVRNYQSRGEQRRLFVLVVMVGVVILLTIEAADPKNWAWFWRMAGHEPAHVVAPADTRVPVNDQRARNADAVVIAMADQPMDALPEPVLPDVDPRWFADVRDDTPFGPSENEALFHLLGALKTSAPDALSRMTLGKVTSIQLFKQPEVYRGQAVTIRGKVEGALRVKAPKNDDGIEEYYQVWVVHEDNQRLIATFCDELPEGFPLGERLKQPIEMTGIFFKRWAYLDRAHVLSSTPLLVARSFTWTPAAKEVVEETGVWQPVVAVSAAVAIALACVWYIMRRRRPEEPANMASRQQRPASLGFDRLKNLELAPDVGESLRRLSSDKSQAPTESEL